MTLPPTFLEFLRTPTAQAVIWCTILIWLVIAGYYLVQQCRRYVQGDVPPSGEHLSTFRKIYEEGELSDTEFRTIRTVLMERRVQTKADATGPSDGETENKPGGAERNS